jgi:hypothetical protein
LDLLLIDSLQNITAARFPLFAIMASSSASSLPLPAFNPARLRSYLLRLPLFTRGCILAVLVFWIVELQTVWSVTQWGSLIPKEIGLGTSGYPFQGAVCSRYNVLRSNHAD